MAEIMGFLKIKRKTAGFRAVCERVKDYKEVSFLPSQEHSYNQSLRCMDCGVPFCHWGCPIGNYIPEWNNLVSAGLWEKAYEFLAATNNLPEVTGRVCPALCEYPCTLGINDDPVTIRENELAIIEYAFQHGLVKPHPPRIRTGKKIAVVGSGPAGLSLAAQLNKAGHKAVVFEKADKIGGILRYGIPNFKLEKWIIDRRLEVLKQEGIVFNTGVDVGKDLKAKDLKKEFDAICLATGSAVPRDLNIEGRSLSGIYFAMDYLAQANKRISGEKIVPDELIDAKDKKVVVIGGGDTGADCVGLAHRQGAKCIVQIEILAKPPECRIKDYPWPKYPVLCKTTTSHEEGGTREWSVSTKKFIGENGKIKKLLCERLNPDATEKEFEIEADLVILALGFLYPEHKGLVKDLGLELDAKGNVKTDENYMTNIKGVFSAGDMRRGQSLVVWAISEGRKAACAIDRYLKGKTNLPTI